MEIHWGIIGCGDVTEIKSGPAFSVVPHSKLVAVMRRDAAKALDYAQRHHVAKWYSDAAQLLADPDVNAIYVATPPDTHVYYAIEALKAGKPVYVEKPMARNSLEAQAILDATTKYDTKLTVAHYRRQQPRFLKIKEIVNSGELGDLLSASLIYSQKTPAELGNGWRLNSEISGGGLFHDLAPHQLDLMLYYFGSPSSIDNILTEYSSADPLNRLSASLSFKKIKIQAKWNFNREDDVVEDLFTIVGSKATLNFGVFSTQCDLLKDGKTESIGFEHLPHVQQPMIAKVVEYFQGKTENPCSANEGVEVMSMMDEIISLNSPDYQ